MDLEAAAIKLRLKQFIEDNPLINQKVVAGKVGYSKSHISQVLDDKRKGSLELIIKIAQAAGTSLIELMTAGTTYIKPTGTAVVASSSVIREKSIDYPSEKSTLLSMTEEIIDSGTHDAEFLKVKIRSFHGTMVREMEYEKTTKKTNELLKAMRGEISALKSQLSDRRKKDIKINGPDCRHGGKRRQSNG